MSANVSFLHLRSVSVHGCCFVYSSAMRNLLGTAGLLGSVSAAFGSILWSQQKTESDLVPSDPCPADSISSSSYELKLVQVLFRHGARTPLKTIPDVMEVKPCVSPTHSVPVSVEEVIVLSCAISIKNILSELVGLIKGPVGPLALGASVSYPHRLRGDGSSGWTQASSSCRGKLPKEHTDRK